jgi:PAS domain S-box-containing protein
MLNVHEKDREFLKQAPDAIIVADVNGKIELWNNRATEIFGYDYEETLGNSLDLIIPERFRKIHWDGFYRAVESGTTRLKNKILTTRSNHKSGKTLYVNLTFSLVKDPSGQIFGVMAIARDFTEQYLRQKSNSGQA